MEEVDVDIFVDCCLFSGFTLSSLDRETRSSIFCKSQVLSLVLYVDGTGFV